MTEHGRAYAVPFGEVWKAALAALERSRRLRVASVDPRAGEIEAEGRSPLLRRRVRARLRLRLDEFGFTRLEARVEPGGARGADRLLRLVDRALQARTPPAG